MRWLMGLFAVVVGGYCIWHHCLRTPDAPADAASDKTEAALPPICGILGERVIAGGISAKVVQFKTVFNNGRGVNFALLDGNLGNAGNEPIRAPAVSVFLFDATGRKHGPERQQGNYNPGTDLNPLLERDEQWAFVVAEHAHMVAAEFRLPNSKTIRIDLTRETDDLVDAKRKEAFEAFERQIAGIKAANDATERQREAHLKTLSNQLDAATARRDAAQTRAAQIEGTLEVLQQRSTLADRKPKGAARTLDLAHEKTVREQGHLAAAKDHLTAAQNERVDHRGTAVVRDAHIAKANDEIARETRHLATATDDEREKATLARDADAAAKRAAAELASAQQQLARLQAEVERENTSMANITAQITPLLPPDETTEK
ncbi:MAG: hypothetical protein NTW87_06340 [Planctomycetota bacterium]|nr:hypothetical protein [Planctomycetota bacterium]